MKNISVVQASWLFSMAIFASQELLCPGSVEVRSAISPQAGLKDSTSASDGLSEEAFSPRAGGRTEFLLRELRELSPGQKPNIAKEVEALAKMMTYQSLVSWYGAKNQKWKVSEGRIYILETAVSSLKNNSLIQDKRLLIPAEENKDSWATLKAQIALWRSAKPAKSALEGLEALEDALGAKGVKPGFVPKDLIAPPVAKQVRRPSMANPRIGESVASRLGAASEALGADRSEVPVQQTYSAIAAFECLSYAQQNVFLTVNLETNGFKKGKREIIKSTEGAATLGKTPLWLSDQKINFVNRTFLLAFYLARSATQKRSLTSFEAHGKALIDRLIRENRFMGEEEFQILMTMLNDALSSQGA